MNLTKKQTMALGALGLATLALVADKTVLSPESASAHSPQAAAVTAPVVPEIKTGVSPESLSANLRLVSLHARELPQPATDPFAWDLPRAEVTVISTAKNFEQVAAAWTVSSIVGSADGRLAVINGKAVRVNENVPFSPTDPRQAKVVEIREGSVVLYHDGQTVAVRLPTTSLSGVE